MFAYLSLRDRFVAMEMSEDTSGAERAGRGATRVMIAWQVAVSILIVGAEYLFSDYAQAKAGKSALFVGAMTVLASLGAILGSLWAARMEDRLERLPSLSALGLLVSLAVLALCLDARAFLAAGVPIFAAGLWTFTVIFFLTTICLKS